MLRIMKQNQNEIIQIKGNLNQNLMARIEQITSTNKHLAHKIELHKQTRNSENIIKPILDEDLCIYMKQNVQNAISRLKFPLNLME